MRHVPTFGLLLAPFLVACVGLVGPTRAQFGTQLVLDSATTSAYAFSGTTANNGDAVFLCKGHNGFSSIRRHAPDGTPIWSKDYATDGPDFGLLFLQADPNGGFLVARQRDSWTQSTNWSDPDTAYAEIDLGSINDNGDPTWIRTLRFRHIDISSPSFTLLSVKALRMTNGEISVVAFFDGFVNPSAFMVIMRFSEDGSDMLEAKQFGHYNPLFPFVFPNSSPSALIETNDGGVLLVSAQGSLGGAECPYIVKFDAACDWIWAKTINYTSGSTPQSTHKAVFAPNGDLLVHHEVGAPGGSTVLHRFASDGSWIRSDLYSDIQWVGSETYLIPMPIGGYVIVKRTGSMLLINEDASPIALYGHPSNIYSGMQYAGSFSSALIQGNELHLYGPFSGDHLIFGNMISWPFFERFDLSGPLEGCNVVDVGVEHYEIPANLLEIVDQNPPPTVDISSTITLTDAVWTTTDLTGLSPLSLCLLIEQLGVGVEEIDGANTTPLLRSNARPAGSMVEVMVPAPGNLQLHDSFGRLVAEKRVLVDGPAQLSAPPVTGQYVLSWTANDGSGRRSERMMVH